MSTKIEPRVPRGMRDILPEQMTRRQYVMDVIRTVFEEFGFEPLQTPAVELEETLKGKYGTEAERLVYSVTYGQGEERLSLRYDFTVPLCRVVSMYPDLPVPFKRYQIAPVWRADRPQKGRFREFYQCDVDTVGSSSMLGDAETVAVIYAILNRLGFSRFKININNRKLLSGIGQNAGVPGSLLRGLYQSIDKLARIGVEGVKQELLAVGLPDPIFEVIRKVARLYLQGKLSLDEIGARLRAEKLPALGSGSGQVHPERSANAPRQVLSAVFRTSESEAVLFPPEVADAVEPDLRAILAGVKPGQVEPDRLQETAGQLISGVTPALRRFFAPTTDLIPEEVVSNLLALIAVKGNNREVLVSLKEKLIGYPEAVEGITELEEMLRYLDLLGVPEEYTVINVSMVRGLEYYTGPVYETIIEEPNVGSVTGGGRYDKLIGLFTERSLPATGTSIGIERVIVIMEELGMFPPTIGRSTTQVLVTAFNREMLNESIRAATRLRGAGLKVQVYFDPDPLREQIGYAVKKDIPTLVILGPDEAAQGQLTIRNLRSKQQENLPWEEAIALLKKWLG